MAEIGYIGLLVALMVAVYSVFTFVYGYRKGHAGIADSARRGILAVFGLLSLAVGILLFALLTHDFQIEYVASYTSSDLSIPYLISALWAGNTGSLLFWAWLLSLFAVIVVFMKRDQGKELVPYTSAILMVVQAFFLILLVSVANPFQQLSFIPAEGIGLNPLLENPGMIVHPPLLLAGYVLFTVPFAFAISALLSRRLGDEWIVAVRRWAIMGWLLLGLGNILGAWWAYVELGWGGYWAWDPVENASFMPWLVATAFLHSIMMQRRRGMLKVWNMVLVILVFSLTIFGTFLTRSGVLSSVHSFGQSVLGPFFIGFLAVILLGSLGLLFYRRSGLKGDAEMESVISRESTFLINNLLIVGAAFAIFLGTVFPVISEWVRGTKITVGPPFFNQVLVPIFLAIIFLTGVCTLIGWRRASPKNLIRNFLWPLVASLILGVGLFVAGMREWYALVAFVLSGFVVFTIVSEWFRGTRARHNMREENYLKAFWGLIWANRPRYGGYIVHIAIILITVGIIGSSVYDVEKEAVLMPGDSMTLGRYTLVYDDLDYYETESKTVVNTSLSVYNGGEMIGRMVPEKYFHRSFEQSVTEVAIRSTLTEDLYVILIGWEESGATSFKVVVNPLVSWIWIGGGVMIVGGLISFWPDRRRPPAPDKTNKGRQ